MGLCSNELYTFTPAHMKTFRLILDVQPATLYRVCNAVFSRTAGRPFVLLCNKHSAAAQKLWGKIKAPTEGWNGLLAVCYSCCHWRWQKQTHDKTSFRGLNEVSPKPRESELPSDEEQKHLWPAAWFLKTLLETLELSFGIVLLLVLIFYKQENIILICLTQ